MIRCCFGQGQHIPGIEDIEAFVFHRSHIEIFNRNYVVLRQIVFPTVGFFIPGHRVPERGEGVVALRKISRASVDPQLNLGAGLCRKPVLQKLKTPRHEGEEIAGLGMWILPNERVMIALITGFD